MKLGHRRHLVTLATSALVLASCGGSDGKNGADGSSGANGASGAVSLIKATPLNNGDTHCPGGGVQIDTGLDNGDGGGTAGNNTLETGEIDATEYVCGGTTGAPVSPLDPPPGAAGTFFISTKGGSSSAAGSHGGYGGYFELETDYGAVGGHLKLTKTGTVDASFTAPTAPATSNYGATPLVVTATTHVKRVTNLTDANDLDSHPLAAGDIVTNNCNGSSNIYVWNSTSSTTQITGIHVQAGATLSFDHFTTGGCTARHINVTYAVRNEGIITSGADATGNVDALYINAGSFLGTTGSSINQKGSNGGNGGYLEIYCASLPDDDGAIWNFGTVDTSGSDGTNGGNAGGLYFWAENNLVNTGALSAKGGNATDAAGTAGSGAGIDIESGYGSMRNSGAIDVSGGNGGQTAGGAGYIDMYCDEYGDLNNTGELKAIGGTPGDSCATACVGGAGGYVYIFAYGDLRNSANISSYGGDGKTGQGGNGNYIEFYTEYDSSLQTGNYDNIHGTIWVSGNLDAHGGNGAIGGGYGGYIDAYIDMYENGAGQGLNFFGYGGGVDTSGGNGDTVAGYGGYAYIQQYYGYDYNSDYTPAGAVVNTVDIKTKGGNAANGPGNYGGYAYLQTDYGHFGPVVGYEKLINTGNIDTSGGNGTTGGGYSGYVYLFGLDGAENHGNITAHGGSASAAGATGGYCDSYEYDNEGSHSIQISSDGGPVVNTGNLAANGGDATAAGGSGNYTYGIQIFGLTTNNSGSLTANGGNGDTASGTGGNGGNIEVRSYSGSSTNTAPSMSATGGAGSAGNLGTPGLIIIDGQLQ